MICGTDKYSKDWLDLKLGRFGGNTCWLDDSDVQCRPLTRVLRDVHFAGMFRRDVYLSYRSRMSAAMCLYQEPEARPQAQRLRFEDRRHVDLQVGAESDSVGQIGL